MNMHMSTFGLVFCLSLPSLRFIQGEEIVETLHLGKQSAYLIGRGKVCVMYSMDTGSVLAILGSANNVLVCVGRGEGYLKALDRVL